MTYEARGSGCVLLVSDSAGAQCKNEENSLVHKVGDINSLRSHFNLLDGDRSYLEALRTSSMNSRSKLTWKAAGKGLSDVYSELLKDKS